MSEVMKALQQSEQAYQAQSMPKSSSGYQHYKQPKSFNQGLIVLVICAPILLVLAFLFYHQKINKPVLFVEQVTKNKPQSGLVETDIAEVEVIESKKEYSLLLPYPDIVATKTLPAAKVVVAPKPASSNTSSGLVTKKSNNDSIRSDGGTIIKTDQINMDDPNSDWGVSDLDLSGVSPELAERFKLALDLPASSRKKVPTSNAIKIPQDTINLVGNENQYYGHLPEMNFETHMYSSQFRSRWVKVNGKEVHEGEWIAGGSVQLEQILPGSLIIQFGGQSIQVPALYEWKG